jgi:hypothetical protein
MSNLEHRQQIRVEVSNSNIEHVTPNYDQGRKSTADLNADDLPLLERRLGKKLQLAQGVDLPFGIERSVETLAMAIDTECYQKDRINPNSAIHRRSPGTTPTGLDFQLNSDDLRPTSLLATNSCPQVPYNRA